MWFNEIVGSPETLSNDKVGLNLVKNFITLLNSLFDFELNVPKSVFASKLTNSFME